MHHRFVASFASSKRGKAFLIVVLLLALSAIAITAYADWYTINTNDHAVDSNWASVGEWDSSLACDDPSIDDRYEMGAAYVTQNGTTMFYRLDTCAIPNINYIRVFAAVDCNNDGDVNDEMESGNSLTGDRILVYRPSGSEGIIMYDGSYAQDPSSATAIAQFTDATLGEWIGAGSHYVFEWKMNLQAFYPGCRGSVSNVGVSLGTINTQTQSEEDASALNTWNNPMDYGDAPGSWDYSTETCSGYHTVLPAPCDGPRHGNLAGGLMLGDAIDPDEGGGQPTADALTDDTAGDTPDDEDGVEATYGVVWTPGGAGSIDAKVSGGAGYLNCWIDWNDDDDFADAGEHIIDDVAVNEGVNTLTFAAPGSVNFTTTPALYTRCRLAPNANEGNVETGPVWGGEVEDYRWLPEAVTADIALVSPNVTISWNNLSQYTDGYMVYRSTSPYTKIEDATGLGPVSASPYTDNNVAGDGTDDNYYYKVVGRRTVDGTMMESTPSNEVGLFEFTLTPGS